MKIEKIKEITKLRGIFGRGLVEETSNKNFYRLFISAEPEYDFINWTKADLVDLCKTLVAFLSEVHSKELRELKENQTNLK